jgi:hypothetical protein
VHAGRKQPRCIIGSFGAIEHDTTAVDEGDIGEDVLDLLNPVRRDDDGAAAIEAVAKQRA